MATKVRTQFVFLKRCGCATGVIEGSHAKTSDRAWELMADTRKAERAMRDAGMTVVHVNHEEYVATFMPMMLSSWTCPHQAGLGVTDGA